VLGRESEKIGEWLFEEQIEVTGTTYTFSFTDSRARRWSAKAIDLSGGDGYPAEWRIFRIQSR
jgi:hypothetical protein